MKVTLFILICIITVFVVSCTKDAEPLPSVTHPEGWLDANAENFHGKKDQAIGSDYCTPCHGVDYSGGTSGVACSDCHANYPHPPTWAAPGDDGSHAAYLKDNGYPLDGCKVCHGADYRGGSSGVSCYTCHPQGPEACNTCHGTSASPVSDMASWAPPKDLDDNLYPEAPGVGFHQLHLKESSLTTAYERECNLCHPSLNGFDDPKHINGVVDIEFSAVANWDGRVTAVYNNDNYKCSNVYCHGNFTFRKDESDIEFAYLDSVMVGNNPELNWTNSPMDSSGCSLCHTMPPNGHIRSTNCSNCHSTVVDADYNIIDPDLHINGEKN